MFGSASYKESVPFHYYGKAWSCSYILFSINAPIGCISRFDDRIYIFHLDSQSNKGFEFFNSWGNKFLSTITVFLFFLHLLILAVGFSYLSFPHFFIEKYIEKSLWVWILLWWMVKDCNGLHLSNHNVDLDQEQNSVTSLRNVCISSISNPRSESVGVCHATLSLIQISVVLYFTLTTLSR